MDYEEKRVRVKDYGTMPADSPLLTEIPGTRDKPRKLHRLAAEAFQKMAARAREELKLELQAASGWRRHRWKSWEHYETTMIKKYGSVKAGRKWLAYNSPHETGLAVDFGVGGLEPNRKTRDKQRKTPLHAWLVEHAAEFGWHPYKNEPWHWEYPISKQAWETGEPDDEGSKTPVQQGDTSPFFFGEDDEDDFWNEAVEDATDEDDAAWFEPGGDDAALPAGALAFSEEEELLIARPSARGGEVGGEVEVGDQVQLRWRVFWRL